jgi:hypothetical protein
MQIGSHDAAPLAHNAAPPLPPLPQPDMLDGFLGAYIAKAAQPHRERLVDVLRVISATSVGHAVLDDFNTLAMQNRTPTVDLLAQGDSALTASATAPATVWLSRDDMTATAREIGVTPEAEHAPAVLWSLVTSRNALRAAAGLPMKELDPVAVLADFRAELAAQKEKRHKQPLDSGDAGARGARRDSASLNGDRASLNGDSKSLHGDSKSLHGDSDSLRGDIESLHGDRKRTHGDRASLHGDSATIHVLRREKPLDWVAPMYAPVTAPPSDAAPGAAGFAQVPPAPPSTPTGPYAETTEPDPAAQAEKKGAVRHAFRWLAKRVMAVRARLGSTGPSNGIPPQEAKPVADVRSLSGSNHSSSASLSGTPAQNDAVPTAEPETEKSVPEKPVFRAAQPNSHRRARSMVVRLSPPADETDQQRGLNS